MRQSEFQALVAKSARDGSPLGWLLIGPVCMRGGAQRGISPATGFLTKQSWHKPLAKRSRNRWLRQSRSGQEGAREHGLRRVLQLGCQILDRADDTKLTGYRSRHIRRTRRLRQKSLHDRTSLHGVMPVPSRMSKKLSRCAAPEGRIVTLLHERSFNFWMSGASGLKKRIHVFCISLHTRLSRLLVKVTSGFPRRWNVMKSAPAVGLGPLFDLGPARALRQKSLRQA